MPLKTCPSLKAKLAMFDIWIKRAVKENGFLKLSKKICIWEDDEIKFYT